MINKFLIYLFLLISLIVSSFSFTQNSNDKILSENPTQFRQYITDETGTLTSAQIKSLNDKLRNEEKTSTNQIIVYLISSLNGESLEDVSIRLAEKNKIGKKDKNNGILMLVVKDDKKIRLEVGYGLEGVMTDALSSKIIRNEITPSFKTGNYYEGINKGVDAIISAIKGEYSADKNSTETNNESNTVCCFGVPIFIVIIFGFIFLFIAMSIIKSVFGAGRSLYTSKRGWDNGGWGGGGFFGGGGSGGSSGGGFSGGGGSFGGGGASGSW
ncbi:MAG: TPM domain-containing protein [Bacteroidota bacterium]|nr:TPM domain-containing protein [Bacteroidota bacterium]